MSKYINMNSTKEISKEITKKILSNIKKNKWNNKYIENKLLVSKNECIDIRRKILDINENLSYKTDDNFYNDIFNKNCENVIGYVKIPVGFAGSININNKDFMVPMATTEGTLIASTSRGMKLINESGGITSICEDKGMTRAPVLNFESLKDALEVNNWIENNFNILKDSFKTTTNHGELTSIFTKQVSRDLYIRFSCNSNKAMGMNMITKGTMACIKLIQEHFSDKQIHLLSLSSNFCTDKKNSAINWILGRSKSVTCEALIDETNIMKTLHVNIDELINLNTKKNLIGSALAGSIGGFNAHAANIVAAIFAATGQDLAQIITSSSCITTMEKVNDKLLISITMPSIEIGLIGGGTELQDQKSCLKLINDNLTCKEFGMMIAGTVMAGELSLLASLCDNTLMSAHCKLNRGLKK